MSDPRFTNLTDPRFAHWRKSTRSGNEGTCVYVSEAADLVAVADSKAGPAAPIQIFSRDRWAAFVAGVKNGAFTR